VLSDLTISGFRCFRELRVPRLTRVNLFVGTNNAGKTSILEAAEILADSTLGSVLSSCLRRGEVRVAGPEDDPSTTGKPDPDPAHLFYWHSFRIGTSFSIRATGNESVRVNCSVVESEATNRITPDLNPLPRLKFKSRFAEWLWTPERGETKIFSREVRPTVTFLGTERVRSSDLGKLWEHLVLTPEEESVTSALRIIEPCVERIAFAGDRGFVKLLSSDQRLPLGNLGDGIKQLLVLALHLASAKDGYFLVDEIDTGLHHTVMVDMWRLVIETAKRLDIQVLATTHSLDCVRALAWVQEQSPDLASEVTLHRVEKDAIETVAYSMEELAIAARHHLEVR
jgi:hypothetical protein